MQFKYFIYYNSIDYHLERKLFFAAFNHHHSNRENNGQALRKLMGTSLRWRLVFNGLVHVGGSCLQISKSNELH